MRDATVLLLDFAFTFAEKAERDLTDSGVHPSAAAIVRELLSELREAATRGDDAAVSFLVRSVNKKIAGEIAWHRHCLRSSRLDHRRRPDADALMESEAGHLLADLQRGASAQTSVESLEVIS